MSRCGVRELPESFKCLSNLLHLDLEYSPIEKGLAGALQGLTALQYLDMSEIGWGNSLEREEMPAAMRNLTNLKVLDLACSLNGCFDVKNVGFLDFIGTLTNLEHLDLSRNELKYVPESIGNLKKLHTLNVKHCNELKSLPESIGGATRLKSVLLDGCIILYHYHYLRFVLMASVDTAICIYSREKMLVSFWRKHGDFTC
jgi:Leucine-rich repeat (LRR) protein